MIPLRRQALLQAMKIFDLFVMVFCFVAAAAVESHTQHATFRHFLAMRIKVGNFLFFSGFVLFWRLILVSCGLYGSKRLSSRLDEVLDIVKATSLGTLALFALTLLFTLRMVTLHYLAFFWVLNCLLILISRRILRLVLYRLRIEGRNLRNIVIVGTNPRAVSLARRLEKKSELGYRIIGFVDDQWHGMDKFRETGYALVGDLGEFPVLLRDVIVDEVMVCLPLKSYYQEISRVIAVCEEQGVITRVLSDLFHLKLAHSTTEHFEGESIITLYTGNLVGSWVLIKRLVDIIFSFILIVILSPLLLITALAIKITSPGPVFFVQKRLGLNKRIISIYKFRTMVPDAEEKLAELEALNEMSGAAFKIKNDPRITPIGKFLRKTSIDELPQLFNVLKGDMSLVGPRPLPVRDFENLDTDWHRRRFSTRPGITCLWQIRGRSDISFDRWMELDMEYIDTWSLWLDLKILLGTIPAVLKGSGAA